MMATDADAKGLHEAWRGWLAEVDRIRSEAIAAHDADLAEKVRGLPEMTPAGDFPMFSTVGRAAVLRLLTGPLIAEFLRESLADVQPPDPRCVELARTQADHEAAMRTYG